VSVVIAAVEVHGPGVQRRTQHRDVFAKVSERGIEVQAESSLDTGLVAYPDAQPESTWSERCNHRHLLRHDQGVTRQDRRDCRTEQDALGSGRRRGE